MLCLDLLIEAYEMTGVLIIWLGKAFCLDDEVKKVLIPSVMEDINHFPEGIYSLKDYTVIVLRGTNVPELIIEEFKLAYEKIAKMR